MWNTKFKIAIATKDVDAINELLDTEPNFSNKKEMQEAMYLMREAVELLYSLQDEVGVSMRQIKQNIKFLGDTLSSSTGRINIKS